MRTVLSRMPFQPQIGFAEHHFTPGLFEGKIENIWPWLLESTGKGILYAPRGAGKTHVIKSLALERDVKHYQLDKNTLDYEVIGDSGLVVIDDVHYVLESMQLARIDGNDINEHALVDYFEMVCADATDGVLFVMDDDPYSVVSRLEDQQAQMRLLSLLEQGLPRHSIPSKFLDTLTPGGQFHELRATMTGAALAAMKTQLEIVGYPVVRHRGMDRNKRFWTSAADCISLDLPSTYDPTPTVEHFRGVDYNYEGQWKTTTIYRIDEGDLTKYPMEHLLGTPRQWLRYMRLKNRLVARSTWEAKDLDRLERHLDKYQPGHRQCFLPMADSEEEFRHNLIVESLSGQ